MYAKGLLIFGKTLDYNMPCLPYDCRSYHLIQYKQNSEINSNNIASVTFTLSPFVFMTVHHKCLIKRILCRWHSDCFRNEVENRTNIDVETHLAEEGMKTHIGIGLAALALFGGLASAQANPTCTTTIVLPGGNGAVLDSSIAAGVCVQSQDKLYGNFNLGNLPTGGSINFGFATVSGIDQHTITFSDPFLPNTTYTDSFEVQVLLGG